MQPALALGLSLSLPPPILLRRNLNLSLSLASLRPAACPASRCCFAFTTGLSRGIRIRTKTEMAAVEQPAGTAKASLPHVERTKGEPRDDSLHTLRISKITHLNPSIRLFQLTPTSNILSSASRLSLRFKPGQWLDVHVPGIKRAGGFTITSSPSLLSPYSENSSASPLSTPTSKELTPPNDNVLSTQENKRENYYKNQNNQSEYLELAIMDSPSSPPAAYLWQPEHQILGTEVNVRVGGSFIWPPPHLSLPSFLATNSNRTDTKEQQGAPAEQSNQLPQLNHAIFIAGGVGINPLMSMISSLVEAKQKHKGKLGFKITFLYSTRLPSHMHEVEHEQGRKAQLSSVLFLDRLRDAFDILADEGIFKVFFTCHNDTNLPDAQEIRTEEESLSSELKGVKVHRRRIGNGDLLDALGPVESRPGTVCYICGVPSMTDEFVEVARRAEGMGEGNVLCEKWW